VPSWAAHVPPYRHSLAAAVPDSLALRRPRAALPLAGPSPHLQPTAGGLLALLENGYGQHQTEFSGLTGGELAQYICICQLASRHCVASNHHSRHVPAPGIFSALFFLSSLLLPFSWVHPTFLTCDGGAFASDSMRFHR
jgi:hypothetical protein